MIFTKCRKIIMHILFPEGHCPKIANGYCEQEAKSTCPQKVPCQVPRAYPPTSSHNATSNSAKTHPTSSPNATSSPQTACTTHTGKPISSKPTVE